MSEVRQRNVALILARELAANLATPMWVWDGDGKLVYVNEPGEAIVGRPYHEIGVGSIEELPQFDPRELDGTPIPADQLSAAIAMRERRPAHRELRITGLDGVEREIAATSYPLFVRGNEFVGVVSVFWELGNSI